MTTTERVVAPAEQDHLARGYSGRMLLLVGLCSLVSHLGWLVIPPLLPAIMDDLAISGGQAGFALTLLTILSAAMRYPGGRLADQLSRKTVLAGCLLAWIAGFGVLAVATNYPLFLLGAALVGLGMGAYVPTAFAQLSDLFVEKQGRAFGVNAGAFNLGGILAAGLAVAVLVIGGWRLAFPPVLVVLGISLVLLHVWSRERYTVRRVDLDVRASVLRVVLDSSIRPILLVAALFAFVWGGAISFLPIFLEAERGLSATAANASFASVFVVGAIVAPLAGAMGDRVGSLRGILAATAIAIAGLSLTILAPWRVGVLFGVVGFAVGLLGFWPLMSSFMMSAFPSASKAGDYGVIGTVYMGVGSVGPTFVGWTGETVDYTAAYAALVGLLVICLGLVALSWRR